jgi:WD40 repeat protein
MVSVILTLAFVACGEPDPAAVVKLIEQLGHDEYARRQEASRQLQEMGAAVVPALERASRTHADPDVRLRAALAVRAITQEVWQEVRRVEGQPGYWLNRVAFTPDGRQAVAAGGAVIVYDLDKGKEVRRTLEVHGARPGLALSRDGKLFLTGHLNDKVVRLGEVESGKEVRTFEGHTAGLHAVALSADGTLAASASADGTLRVWDVKTGKELRRLAGFPDAVRSLAFAPEGVRLLSGHQGVKSDFAVRLWDAGEGKELRVFKGHAKEVTAVAFGPSGRTFVSASVDGTLRVWDAESGKEIQRMEHAGGIRDLAVSPDGRRALSAGFGDRTVRLWDLTNGKELYRLEGHSGGVLGVAFAADGKRALSCDTDCTIRLWRLAR